MTEMVGWHHQLDGHEFEQAPGVGGGQGSLAYRSPWSRKESGTTERPNRNELPALDRELPETWMTSSASPLILSLFPSASCVCVSHKMQSHTLSVIKSSCAGTIFSIVYTGTFAKSPVPQSLTKLISDKHLHSPICKLGIGRSIYLSSLALLAQI